MELKKVLAIDEEKNIVPRSTYVSRCFELFLELFTSLKTFKRISASSTSEGYAAIIEDKDSKMRYRLKLEVIRNLDNIEGHGQVGSDYDWL